MNIINKVCASTLLLLLPYLSIGSKLSPKDFEFYIEDDKTTIFLDNFDKKDDSSWIGRCGCKSVTSIETAGFFYFVNNERKKGYYRIPAVKEVDIDKNKDFEIEIRVKIRSDNHNDFGILFWGKPIDSSNKPFIKLFFRNQYTYIEESGKLESDSSNYFDLQTKGTLKKSDFNVYTIRKIGFRYFAFINGQFSKMFIANPLNGPMLGLGGSSENVIVYDYIKISYLNGNKEYLLPPEYLNGEKDIYNYLRILTYPKAVREKCMQGKFIVKLHISLKGKIDSIISYSGYDLLNKTIHETFSLMPGTWHTAIKNGAKTDGWFIMPMALRSCPDNKFTIADYYYKKAMDAYKADKEDEAIENFKIAAGMDYTDVNSLYNIAGIYLNEGKESEARYWLQRMNELRDFDIPELEGIDAKITALGADELIKKYCN